MREQLGRMRRLVHACMRLRVCGACAHHEGDVSHAQLRGKRLDVVLAVTLHVRQVLRVPARASMTHQPRAQLCAAASAHARARNTQTALTQHTRTFVIAMTVAKSVTKQVMNVMAGLHCRRGARGRARAPGQRGLPGQRCPR